MEAEAIERIISEIRGTVGRSMDMNREFSDEETRELIVGAVFEKARVESINAFEKIEIVEAVFNSMRRFDILQPLLDDVTITEIMVNGPDNIFVEREGRVNRLDMSFSSSEKLEDVIQMILAKANRTVNDASPIVDARMPDGSRLNVVLDPIALNGPALTIRKFPENPLSIKRMAEAGTLSFEAAEALENMVRAKYNLFICGGTGSGKTTLLNALAGFIPAEERIITIEDSAELQLKGADNLVRMEIRDANTEGKGQITIRDLIRTSLRMRPERIVVGEVRGSEALDMLQAMNTGHQGSMSTGHSNSALDCISRLETMVLGAASLPLEAIRQQIASAIDIIIHISRLRDRSRKVIDISEIAGVEDGRIILNKLFEFVEEKPDTSGMQDKVTGSLKKTGNPLIHVHKLEMAGCGWRL
ncbi:MAG: CpaF family protein [Clostridiales bacterium]|nr:CpaF family protein [Clostridiales bacterium]